jgi:prepilin-type N-terminal cleavage/methylation domain-containing protein
MYSTLKKIAHSGFTLVELLIVVVILAILAAIVIPQFSSSSTDAREAALDVNLGTMRSAIELFKAQHGFYPGATATTGATCTGGTAVTAGVDTSGAVISHLTQYSGATGLTCTGYDTINRFGPYLRKAFPNDLNNVGTILVTNVGTPIVPGTAGGWAYDDKSGQILMNNTAVDSTGKKYSDH